MFVANARDNRVYRAEDFARSGALYKPKLVRIPDLAMPETDNAKPHAVI